MPKFKYLADSGQIHLGVMDADRIAIAGAEPDAAATSSIRVKISKSNREYGLRPRGVRLARTIGVAPDTFVKYAFLPVLNGDDFESPQFGLGVEKTYGGNTWEIIGKVNEDF